VTRLRNVSDRSALARISDKTSSKFQAKRYPIVTRSLPLHCGHDLWFRAMPAILAISGNNCEFGHQIHDHVLRLRRCGRMRRTGVEKKDSGERVGWGAHHNLARLCKHDVKPHRPQEPHLWPSVVHMAATRPQSAYRARVAVAICGRLLLLHDDPKNGCS
jgi:hypothetical protein